MEERTIVVKIGKSKMTAHCSCKNFDKEKHQDLFAKTLVELMKGDYRLNTDNKE